MIKSWERGFLVLEILIAGLILTASIAVTMYMFQLGYSYLEKTRQSNVVSSTLIQAAGLIKTLDLDHQSGMEEIGDNVKLIWNAKLLGKSIPRHGQAENEVQSPFELLIYQVDFTLKYREVSRDYRINVFKYKPLLSGQSLLF
jgi:hypothetical protein